VEKKRGGTCQTNKIHGDIKPKKSWSRVGGVVTHKEWGQNFRRGGKKKKHEKGEDRNTRQTGSQKKRAPTMKEEAGGTATKRQTIQM